MTLRSRFAWTLLAATVPFSVLVAFGQATYRERITRRAYAAEIDARMELGGREQCERAPRRWPRRARRAQRGRHGRGQHARGQQGRGRRQRALPRGISIFDDRLQSTWPGPPLDPQLRSELEQGAEYATRVVQRGERRLRLFARRMPWNGPCAVVLVTRPEPKPALPWTLGSLLVLSLLTMGIAYLAAGPIVRRIRRLTNQVRRARLGQGVIDTRGNDEIAELARAFAEDREALEAQMTALEDRDRALKDYISNTTHDVMLPLTVLQGHLVALRDESGSSEKNVARALEESHYLASMLRNLNAAARLEAGVPETRFDAVNINKMVERVVGRHEPIARQAGIELHFSVPESPVSVRADLTLLEQAVSNLVHNAVRHSRPEGAREERPGGHIAVILERLGEGFRIEVVDDGPGVSAAELKKISERRWRGEAARSRHPSGMGLGLAIARDVADRHGFDLRFERPEAGGFRAILEAHRSASVEENGT